MVRRRRVLRLLLLSLLLLLQGHLPSLALLHIRREESGHSVEEVGVGRLTWRLWQLVLHHLALKQLILLLMLRELLRLMS